MKISCQSCQAKYTIADEKVLGKIVKIRCKKCSSTIVINGNEQAGAAPASGQVYDYAGAQGGGEQWTVNVADGDQRTMTSHEIAEAYHAGVVNDETYCWKDGMSDWLPLREIEALYAACTMSRPSLAPDPSHAQMPAYPGPQQMSDDQPTRVQESNLGALFNDQGMAAAAAPAETNGNGYYGAGAPMAAAAAPAPTAARRAGGRGGGGADLFGAVAQAGGEDDVMTSVAAGGLSAPAPAGDGKLTGQRNENSVLFSLSALTQNAPKEDKVAPQGEGSGLIDIRALAQSMESKETKSNNKVDDIMNLAGGGAFTPALAAPVLAPPAMDGGSPYASIAPGAPAAQNKTLIYAILGGAAFIGIIIIVVAAIALSGNKGDTGGTAASATATSTAPTSTAATTTTTPTATDTATAAPTGTATETATAPATATNKPPPVATGNKPPPTTTNTPPPATTTRPPPPATTTARPASGPCGCAASDVDCAIRCAAKGHR